MVNEIMKQYFDSSLSSKGCSRVAQLPKGALIEADGF